MSYQIMFYILVALAVILIIFIAGLFIYLIKKSKTIPTYELDTSNIARLNENLLKSTELTVKSIIADKMHDFEKKQIENRIKELEEYNNSVGKISSLKEEITTSITSFKEDQAKTINANLEKNFGQTKEIIEEVTKRLTQLDSAQTQITDFKETLDEFSHLLTDKKARGSFGEFQLEAMVESVVGENENSIFKRQHKLSNNKMVDGLLLGPKEIGNIPIDSKFPLDNYREIINAKTTQEKESAQKAFKEDCLKQIKEISEKYIIRGETADFAFMFIPAEAIFIALHSHEFKDVLKFAKKNKVHIVSPSTLFLTIRLFFDLSRQVGIQENLKPILNKLEDLKHQFEFFKERWEKFIKALKSEEKAINELNITQGKIIKNFTEISSLSHQGKLIESADFEEKQEQ